MSGPVWIDEALVLAIHDRQLIEHGGGPGLRDPGLLESALGRPINRITYAGSDIIELTALYTAGIVQDHPFLDGNKRSGFVVGILFLELNGCLFTAGEAVAAQAVLDLAAGRTDEAGFREFLRAHVKPPA
jgi:death-on-curing protein